MEQGTPERREPLQIAVAVGNDLAQEGVELHERAQTVRERFLVVRIQHPEAVGGGLQLRFEARMVVRPPQHRRQVEGARERLDLALVVDLHRVEFVLQRLELVRVGGGQQFGPVVVRREGFADVLRVVHEIEHERRRFARRHAVEARERLHGLHAVQALVDVHRLQ